MKIIISAFVLIMASSSAYAQDDMRLNQLIDDGCQDVEAISDFIYYDDTIEHMGSVSPVELDRLGNEYPSDIFRDKEGRLIVVQYNPHEQCSTVEWQTEKVFVVPE